MVPSACVEWLSRSEAPDCANPVGVVKAADILH